MWNNIYGNTVSWIPTGTIPDAVSTLTSFEAPSNIGDYYAQRLRGYLTAPATGDYTFWISGDNNVSGVNATPCAEFMQRGCCGGWLRRGGRGSGSR